AAGGAVGAARGMFISAADLRALVVIVVAAAATGVVVAPALGARVAAGSRALVAAARRIGEGSPMPALPDLATGELALIGDELGAMNRHLEEARRGGRARGHEPPPGGVTRAGAGAGRLPAGAGRLGVPRPPDTAVGHPGDDGGP